MIETRPVFRAGDRVLIYRSDDGQSTTVAGYELEQVLHTVIGPEDNRRRLFYTHEELHGRPIPRIGADSFESAAEMDASDNDEFFRQDPTLGATSWNSVQSHDDVLQPTEVLARVARIQAGEPPVIPEPSVTMNGHHATYPKPDIPPPPHQAAPSNETIAAVMVEMLNVMKGMSRKIDGLVQNPNTDTDAEQHTDGKPEGADNGD